MSIYYYISHSSINHPILYLLSSIKDTYAMTEEELDEEGKAVFKIPFKYSHQIETSATATHNPTRARRLAQEVSSLSTSLPLSSSSSVFVRCDEERLDVMKVYFLHMYIVLY